MYIVEPLPTPIDPALLALLVKAEPATIGHVLHSGFMDTALRGLLPDIRIAGTAVTVRQPGADCTMIHYALGKLRAGDVLVIDRGGTTAMRQLAAPSRTPHEGPGWPPSLSMG
jgi:regulator of RNase E activity RraA